jgi:hypothetical protein
MNEIDQIFLCLFGFFVVETFPALASENGEAAEPFC